MDEQLRPTTAATGHVAGYWWRGGGRRGGRGRVGGRQGVHEWGAACVRTRPPAPCPEKENPTVAHIQTPAGSRRSGRSPRPWRTASRARSGRWEGSCGGAGGGECYDGSVQSGGRPLVPHFQRHAGQGPCARANPLHSTSRAASARDAGDSLLVVVVHGDRGALEIARGDGAQPRHGDDLAHTVTHWRVAARDGHVAAGRAARGCKQGQGRRVCERGEAPAGTQPGQPDKHVAASPASHGRKRSRCT